MNTKKIFNGPRLWYLVRYIDNFYSKNPNLDWSGH